jgi:gamma-glutamylcyclotransferase (GGCT)/AIG2-like uncharacterized protein YtfP
MGKNKLYFAYGMNTNHKEMKKRCPNAEFIGVGELKGYELKFRGVADVEKSKGSVIGAIWDITPLCEMALDILEGYPNLYRKEYKSVDIMPDNCFVPIVVEKERKEVMFYKMNDERNEGMPSEYYFNMLFDGYEKSQVPKDQMQDAFDSVGRSIIGAELWGS